MVFVRGRAAERLPLALRTPFDNFDVNVFDERGHVLGQLKQNSWFALERPPGPQEFFASSSPDCAIRDAGSCVAPSNITGIRAELLPGRVYAVFVERRFGPATTFREAWQTFSDPCPLELDEQLRPEFVELVGEPAGGSRWPEVSQVMRTGSALGAAPQRLEHFLLDGAEVVRAGRMRLHNGCVPRERFIEQDDGSMDWPLNWSPASR